MENPLTADKQFRVVPPTYKPSRKSLQGDPDPEIVCSRAYTMFCFFGTVFFFIMSPLFVELSNNYVPDIDTGSEMFESWYYRITINTTWFPLS